MTDQDPEEPKDKRELLAAFDQVVNREHVRAVERASKPLARRTSLAIAVVCVFAWGGLAYTWIAKPAWLFPKDPWADMTPQAKEHELRFAIYLERERVLDFRKQNGRLPSTLAEAGPLEQGVEYVVTGDSTFVISGEINGVQLRLAENEPAEELLKPTGIKPSRRP